MAIVHINTRHLKATNGDWLASAVLTQIDYWTTGKNKEWVAKTCKEWAAELDLPAKSLEKAINRIKLRGWATWKLGGFNGHKTTWWKPAGIYPTEGKRENPHSGVNGKYPQQGKSFSPPEGNSNTELTSKPTATDIQEREIQYTTPPSEDSLIKKEKPKAALNAEVVSAALPPVDLVADAGEMVAAVQAAGAPPSAPPAEPNPPPAQTERLPLGVEVLQEPSPQSENSLSLIEATAPALTPELSARWTFARTQIEYLAGNSLWSTWLSRIEFTGMDGAHLLFSAPNTYIAEYVQNRVNREMRRWLADCGFGDYEALTITVTAATIEDENPFASPVKSENSLSFGEGVDRAARENNFTLPPTDAQECYRIAKPQGKDIALLARLISEYGATDVVLELRRIDKTYEAGNMTRYLQAVLENKRKAAA